MAIIDKIKGIFTGEDSSQQEPINTPEQQKLVSMVMQDYAVFKEARQPIEPIWRQEQRFYMGDHWHGLRPESVSKLRPNSVDNIAWSQIENIVSKLTGWMPYPEFEPQESGDDEKAKNLNDYMPYELRCIKFKQKHIRAVRRFVIHGPLIYKTIYDPTVEFGKGMHKYIGQNDIIPVDLGSFFPDPRIRDFIYLQKGKAHIIHTRKPIEYFRERWPKQGKKVMPDTLSEDVHIFDENEYSMTAFNTTLDNGTYDPNTDSQTCGLIEYWYRGVPKYMSAEDKRLFREMGDEKLANGIDPSECYAKSKGTAEGIHCIYISSDGVFLEHKAYVYDHGQYPFVARTLFPDEQSVWGKGFMRDMIKPQIMKNKFAEIAVETMAKAGNNAIVYEEGAITKPQTWKEQRSLPGAMLPVANGRMNDWKELQGVNVPNTVFNMLQYYDEMLQKIPGQFDSANGMANPNVTSGEQAKALINAASIRLNLPAEIIQDALEEVFAQYIELMAQFYTDERIGRITGRMVSMSRNKILSYAPTIYRFTDPTTGEEIEQTVYEEYVPKFDIRVNISVDRPHDREYWVQLAFNLLQMKDPLTGLPMMDGVGVTYAIDNGRLEPFEKIRERIEQKAGLMQQFQQMQMQMQEMGATIQQLQQALGQQQQANVQAEADLIKAQTEAEREQFNRAAQMRKLQIDEANAMARIAGVR